MTRRALRSRFGFYPRALAVAAGCAAFCRVSPAAAQPIDISPPLPNVLLLVDTSGSMEFQPDGSTVTCNPGNPALTNHKSRWTSVVEVLTGTLNDYSCEAIDRASNTFKNGEYQLITGTAPYDWRYPVPFHRPLSGGATGCAARPGTLPGPNPFVWPNGAVSYHPYNNASASCIMSQQGDGILDVFGNRVRFGLMTFDTEVDAGTGFGGSYTSANADLASGQQGLFSYVVGSAATGRPMGCAPPSLPQEVGARNGAAPAWEGRMVNFGHPNDSERANERQASRIQEVLLATRPFGATPIAGMLRDAEDFFWNEASDDPDVYPSGAAHPFDDYGPRNDPYLECDVPREQVIILLTDGEPNMDLRPFCSDAPTGSLPAGACPFDLPETIANRLANPPTTSRKPIKTFVVGFALEDVDADLNPATPAVSCNTLVSNGVLSSDCAAPGVEDNVPLKACCTLQRIALAGAGQAFFANNPGQLRAAISEILRRSVPTTSRTQPVVAGGGVAAGGSYRFFSGFEVGQLSLWNGSLVRERWACEAPSSGTGPKEPKPQPLEDTKGDFFVENVNDAGPSGRRIYTVVGKTGAGVVQQGGQTVRRGIGATDPDGAGTLAPEIHTGLSTTFASAVPPEAMAIPTASYPSGVTTTNAARTFYLQWLLGVNATNAEFHRCRTSSSCNLIGDIYHSTPQVIGSPSALLRDESYERFAVANATRPIVLYTSTNDGFLHAFKVTSNDPADKNDDAKKVLTKANNELWAFAPPAVLPYLHTLYPYNHQLLLDGVATIRDVVAVEQNPVTNPPTVFERTATDARAGGGTWRTVLVQSFGAEHGGYFALDVTNPVPDASNPNDTDRGGPRFLWQLTRDASGNPLFGRGGATPAIATLFFDPTGGTNPREIPVAILPGGRGGTRQSAGTGCPSTARTFSGSGIDSRFTPRGKVNCYDWGSGNVELGARSLTIVRLDTGEIVRTFRQTTTEVASATLRNRVTVAELDSPITGQPVAFPNQPGAVADRILVGDQDGRLWKVNVAPRNPASWTMTLFFDLYPASISSTTAHDHDDGQPISTPPVLSVDENGNMTVAVATGDQDALGPSAGQVHYIYSLTEDFDFGRTAATHRVNWLKAWTNGQRVVGPLNLFNGELFFVTFPASVSSDVCTSGTSQIWGMNYLDPDPSDFQQGGAGVPTFGGDQALTPPIPGLVPGLAVAQQPSCYDTLDDAVGDDLVGFGGLRRISQITPGKFQLIMHTSPPTGTATGLPVQTETIDLATPPSLSRVSSWASIVE